MEIRFELLPLPNYYTAPVHPHATDVAVYTALFSHNMAVYQYGRNEDKVLKCTNIPSDIDSIHNRRPKPSFGDIWSTARGPRHPPPLPRGG